MTFYQLGLCASQLAQIRARMLSIEFVVVGEVGAASGTGDFTILPRRRLKNLVDLLMKVMVECLNDG